MADETVADLVEVLLQQRDPAKALLSEGDIEVAFDAGGQAAFRPAAAGRAYSVLGRAARAAGGIASYRVIGRHTAFLMVVSTARADVALTLMNADSGVPLCHCEIRRGRDAAGKPDYMLLLGASESTTPFGVSLMDALLQASLRKGGLSTLD